jgi:chromate transport protein ChrA
MALFEIYKRIGKSGRHDGNILILKDKLSIIALIFPPLWLIINKNFFLIPIYFLAIFFIIFLSNKTGQEIIIFSVIFCHFFLCYPSKHIEGVDFKVQKLSIR